jgi:putative transposase
MQVRRSGYYAWRAKPQSARALEDRRLLGLIKHAWLESGTVYGYRKVTSDLRDLGERCGKHRVYKLMRLEGLAAQRGYGRRPRHHSGTPASVAPNRLQQNFSVAAPGDFQGSCRVNHSRSLLFLPAIDVMFRVEPDRRHQRPVPGLS